MPTIPPNNTSGLYGIDGAVVPIGNDIEANNISATGNVTVDGYLLVDGSITTNSNFVGNLVGNVLGNIVLSGSNTQVVFNDSGLTGGSNAFTFNKATNVVSVGGSLTATGNVQGAYILGNGSQLTGLPATYTDANVVSLMASFGSNTISTSGNITGGFILGNGSQLTGLPQVYGNANVAAFLASGTDSSNIITSGTVQGEDVTAVDLVQGARFQTTGTGGNITGANYISANYFVGDGQYLTNLPVGSYSNANVANYLPTYSGNITAGNISATGNIDSFRLNANAAFLTEGVGIYNRGPVRFYDTDNSNYTDIRSAANATANVIYSLPSSDGSNGQVLTTNGGGALSWGTPAGSYGNSNVATFLAAFGSNTISTSGNITSGNFIGDGQFLTNLAGGNVTGTVANATYALTANAATFAGTVTTNAQPNITSVGTLSSLTSSGNVTGGNLLTAGLISATGNITGNYILGNGSQLTGLPATYGNANVATYLADFGSNTISTSGNITSGNIIANGQFLTNLPGANVTGTVANATYALNANAATYAGTVTTNAQPNITSVGTLSSVSVTGNVDAGNLHTAGVVSAAGNITGNYILGNGSQLTGLPETYGNANVANYLPTYSGNIGVGNITGSTVKVTSTINATSPTDGALVVAGGAGINNDLHVGGTIYGTFAGNISGNLVVPGADSDVLFNNSGNAGASSNFQFDNANSLVKVSGAVSVSGNITGGNFIGNGQYLTSLPAANVTGTVANATYALNANAATYAGTVTTNAQPNITSVGTLSSVSITGNATMGNLVMSSTSGAAYVNNITGLAGQPITIESDGTEDINLNADTIRVGDNNADATISSRGTGDLTLRTHLGDANQGNIIIRDGASGNIDIQTNGSGVVNITGTAGMRVTDGVSALGNITGNYFIGNGSQLTGLPASYSNANVATFLAAFGANTISTSGNITAGNFIGDGSTLTNITGANVSGTVANATYALNANAATYAGTVTTNAQPNITSVGTLTSVTSTGNITGGNILTGGIISATGNITGNYFIGNGSQLTGITATATPAGANTELQFNNASSLGASANLTFDLATGNFAAGNIVIQTTTNGTNGVYQNWIQQRNPKLGNTATFSSYAAARYLFGTGLGPNSNSTGDFSTTYDAFSNDRNARVLIADRFEGTDTGIRSRGLVVDQVVDVSGNVNTSNSNTRFGVFNAQMSLLGNGNVVATNPVIHAPLFATLNIGNQGALTGSGPITATAGSAIGPFLVVGSGSTLTTGMTINPNVVNSGTLSNWIVLSPTHSSTNPVGNLAVVQLQQAAGNSWGIGSSQLPTSNYWFLQNNDDRSKSRLGPLESYFDRPYTFTTTTGNVNLDWTNGTSQYLKPTGNMNLSFTGATVSSNGNLYHTVTLLVEQGTTAYTITLPTANATIKYAGGVSTVPGTANNVVMITSTAANINGSTTYLTTISPEFS